jgi:Cu(I)/Ag(I) efflux system membrane fusion protein
MKTKVVIGGVLVLLIIGGVLVVPRLFRDRTESAHQESGRASVAEFYTCPMHPSVRSDHPGACPICGMALVKKTVGPDTTRIVHEGLGPVSVSPSQQVLANVKTVIARSMMLRKEIRAVGTISAAEPNVRRISARFPGRLDHLYLTYTGQTVRKGDPVADVYSPEAISAQQEFLLALGSSESVQHPDGESGLLAQSREKLVRWGFTRGQIDRLVQTQKVQDVVTIYSPIGGTVIQKKVDPQHYAATGEDLYEVADLSTVWMNADVYEYEMRALKVGQTVEATSDAYPGTRFTGRITFISPSIDPSSRTVRVRAEFANPLGRLRTDMFVDASIRVQLPEAIAVPASAVLSTGQRNVIWVQKEEGIFEPRYVVLGESAEGFYQILEGIHGGDIVAESGGYLLDSESQLKVPAMSAQEHPM